MSDRTGSCCAGSVHAGETSQPSAILGAPSGLHWAAHAPDGHPSEQTDVLDRGVSGKVIRFMWDYGVLVPLWDQEGLLPEEREWLRRVLLVSEELITDMTAWGDYMNRLDGEPSLRTDESWAEMNRRGQALAERLQAELGSNYIVQYKAW